MCYLSSLHTAFFSNTRCRREMHSRDDGYIISRPQAVNMQQAVAQKPLLAPATAIPANGSRPLSDIRELSEPSIAEPGARRPPYRRPSLPTSNSLRHMTSFKRNGSARSNRVAKDSSRQVAADTGSSSYSSTPEQGSFYSIPHTSVPRRTSSSGHARKPSIHKTAPPARPFYDGFTVPNHGPSRSPVKEARAKQEAVRSDTARRVPSKTYLRMPHPTNILDSPVFRHPRVKLELQVSAPLSVGGGSVEGQIRVTVDENDRTRARRSLSIGALSADLLGFEDMPSGRRAIFLAVGTDLIDAKHEPPAGMVEPANPLVPNESFWTLTPSTSSLPFMISLPLDTGPPSFQSKNASIRYLLCATALISDASKHYQVRTSQEVNVVPTYDPEKALTSLSSPLTATDELPMTRLGRSESVKLTAGLHRQVWVSGGSIFVDVHIANKSHKPVKRLELSLERNILCYKHAPASTREKSASQARIFESNEQTLIQRVSLKPGSQGWQGVEPKSSETRTCELELPRGHATVRCGKYFEVRFFLNVAVSVSNTKLVSVQLPIIMIHINSLDVLPNSVAQVAAAIEEKKRAKQHHRHRSRSRSKQHLRTPSGQRSVDSTSKASHLQRQPSYGQGRAFSAPRQQVINQQRAVQADVEDLQQKLDASPRKQPSKRSQRGRGDAVGFGSFNNLRRKESQGSVQSKPKHNFTVITNQIEPHTLGLTSFETSQRPGTGLSFREKLDRSRFEFPSVKKKPTTGSLKEKSMHLWGQVKDRSGWI